MTDTVPTEWLSLPRTKADAKEQGSKRFFTGVLCGNGHLSVRYASTGQCKACVDAHTKRKSPEEQERLRQIRREWTAKKLEEDPRYWADKSYARLDANRDEWNARARERDRRFKEQHGVSYSQVKRRRSLQARITTNLRRRLHKAVGGSVHKAATTMKLLGCSREVLLAHLEAQFQDGMTWENYGEWHIDHKRPCASFDLSDPEQQKACFHYSNLQPLWGIENLRKNDSWDGEP